jgi:hypothetical protein
VREKQNLIIIKGAGCSDVHGSTNAAGAGCAGVAAPAPLTKGLAQTPIPVRAMHSYFPVHQNAFSGWREIPRASRLAL